MTSNADVEAMKPRSFALIVVRQAAGCAASRRPDIGSNTTRPSWPRRFEEQEPHAGHDQSSGSKLSSSRCDLGTDRADERTVLFMMNHIPIELGWHRNVRRSVAGFPRWEPLLMSELVYLVGWRIGSL